MGLIIQPDPGQQFPDMLTDHALRRTLDLKRQGDIFERRQMTQQSEILIHNPDLTAQGRQIRPWNRR